MSLDFKTLCIAILLWNISFAQDEEESKEKKFVPITVFQIGYLVPTAYGSNFLNDALDLSNGYLADYKLHITPKIYVGVQKTFFKADVMNQLLAGVYDDSKISHHYAQVGTTIFPLNSKFNILAGGGVGYAYYKNFKSNTKFSDDGFSLMGNVTVNYHFDKVIGLFAAFQLSRDFLSINTAPELDKFLNNATFSTISFGVQIKIE